LSFYDIVVFVDGQLKYCIKTFLTYTFNETVPKNLCVKKLPSPTI